MKNTLQKIKGKIPSIHIPLKLKEHLKSNGIWYILLIIGIVLFSILLSYGIKKSHLKTTNNTNMESQLESVPVKISNINTDDGNFQHNLRDYYVMSSYNSCCGGGFNNNFVDYEPLKQVIRRGARVLDFEVYSVDNKTVIAASPTDNFYLKGTYNSLPFNDVMDKINNYAFSHGTCPNADDPLFLHFRVKSKKPHVFDDMTKSMYQNFVGRKLGSEYAYEYNNENLGMVPLKNLQGKVIIMCSRSNDLFEKSSFNEFVNIASGGHFLSELRNYDIQFTHSFNELIDTNKKNMALTMPDLSNTDKNMPVLIHLKYGCQMPCMNFQNLDSNLQYYLNFFNKSGSAFSLKPVALRYVPVTVVPPKTQNPKLSYARRVIKKPYFTHEI